MFTSLTIYLKEHIKKDLQKFDDLITIESVRDYIISATSAQPEMIRNIINLKEREMPKVIYSRPNNNMVRIFGIGDKGIMALNAILATLNGERRLRVKNINYGIRDMKLAYDLPFLPTSTGGWHEYTTLTPISVFNNDNYRMFHHYEMLHCGGKMSNATPQQKAAFTTAIQEFVTHEIRDSIKYMLSQVIPTKRKEDFLFVDHIQIEWDNFTILPRARFHTEENGTPMMIGRFRSNFVLPKFVGLRIGKGFGELSHKRSFMTGAA